MIRVQLARITGSLRWSTPTKAARLFMAFARAERSSHYDMLAAARLSPDPARRAEYLLHASDEARHALMFTLRAEQLDHAIAADPHEYIADFEHLFERLGEIGFLAFVHLGEQRGRRQFAVYRDELAKQSDDKGRALFDAVLVDEARHETYTKMLLDRLCGGDEQTQKALRRARRWELWRGWLRLGRVMSGAVFTWSMRLVYVLLLPFALIEKARQK